MHATEFANIADIADALHAGILVPTPTPTGATRWATTATTDGGRRRWATDGDAIWNAKTGGRCYMVDAIRTGGTDPGQREAILRTAAMRARRSA